MNTPNPNPSEFEPLRRRLWAHPFEHPDQGMDIVRRLMNEQGWSLSDAREAVEEYRRFCFLAVVAPHSVTPSQQVDLVWHTHLLYTRDYWDEFCPRVLGRSLHHGPSKGQEEDTHFYHQYGATLDLYQQCFGEINEKWWPHARKRFQPVVQQRWVDLSQVWVVHKPKWLIPLLSFIRTRIKQ